VIDVADLVSRSVELIRPTFPGVDLKWSPPAQPVRVRAAAEQIKQVLLNLIQNSFSAISTGKLVRQGQIIVNVRYEGKTPKRQVIIEVEDNGPGIHSVHFSKIFIPFFTTLPSGTGLGLSICQKIIEDHQGRIEVATEVGRFTRFSVILPAADLAD
jgi:signal transduction histidine kinase